MLDRVLKLFRGGILSRYRVDNCVTRHQFFTISTGRDRKTMRPVLVKIYSREGAAIEAKIDVIYRERPLAETLPALSNRFMVRTLEAGSDGGKRIEILEAAPTTTLKQRMSTEGLAPTAFRRAILQICEGVSYLHSRGHVHRGLCPETIVVSEEGDAKIIDLSLVMDASRTHVSGTMVGPNGYVAPEIIKRSPVDARSDIYSLGVICYEAFSGTLPFPHVKSYEGLVRMMNQKPAGLAERNAGVPAGLDAVVMKAIAKSPGERYQTVEEFMNALAAAPLPESLSAKAPAFAA